MALTPEAVEAVENAAMRKYWDRELQQKLRREMMKQARLMLKGSVMTPRQVVYAARTMVDQALAKERQHGKTERSSTQ
jgi:hypothetical protein